MHRTPTFSARTATTDELDLLRRYCPAVAWLVAEGCIVAGGAVVDMLDGRSDDVASTTSDVDVFVPQRLHDCIDRLVREAVDTLERHGAREFRFARLGATLTVFCDAFVRPLQFILVGCDTAQDVVGSFDMDFVQCAVENGGESTVVVESDLSQEARADRTVHYMADAAYNTLRLTARCKKALYRGFAFPQPYTRLEHMGVRFWKGPPVRGMTWTDVVEFPVVSEGRTADVATWPTQSFHRRLEAIRFRSSSSKSTWSDTVADALAAPFAALGDDPMYGDHPLFLKATAFVRLDHDINVPETDRRRRVQSYIKTVEWIRARARFCSSGPSDDRLFYLWRAYTEMLDSLPNALNSAISDMTDHVDAAHLGIMAMSAARDGALERQGNCITWIHKILELPPLRRMQADIEQECAF
jgi:hypothetical protein